MRTENLSGLYWEAVVRPFGWFDRHEEEGSGFVAARIPGMCVEYLVFLAMENPGEAGSWYELYEVATSWGCARDEEPVGPPMAKCATTFPPTRAGFAEALAYLATVVSDQWVAEGDERHA